MNSLSVTLTVGVLALSARIGGWAAPGPATYEIPAPAGFALLANNLNTGGNTIAEVLPKVAEGTVVYRLASAQVPDLPNVGTAAYVSNRFENGVWQKPDWDLSPGQGFWVESPGPQVLLFAGGSFPPPVPRTRPSSGWYLVGCPEAKPCGFEELVGYPPTDGDELWLHEAGKGFQSFRFELDLGEWVPRAPIVAVGQGAILRIGTGPEVIEPGLDLFTTPPGGATSQSFAEMPIPADFFGPGSEPFEGRIDFQGAPVGRARNSSSRC